MRTRQQEQEKARRATRVVPRSIYWISISTLHNAAMVVYSFYIFDRHGTSHPLPSPVLSPLLPPPATKANHHPADCIYKKKWTPRPNPNSTSTQPAPNGLSPAPPQANALSAEDDAKLIFGTIFSLRNMVRKLGGPDDQFISYRTGHYKLHYYETPTGLKFVMVTDTKTNNLRIVLHQIYVSLYVEYGELGGLQAPRVGAGWNGC